MALLDDRDATELAEHMLTQGISLADSEKYDASGGDALAANEAEGGICIATEPSA